MAKKQSADDASSVLDHEARALAPAPSRVTVKAPLDKSKPETWGERVQMTIYVRPMSAEEIVEGLGRLMPISERMEGGLSIVEIAREAFDELLQIAETCTSADAATLRGLDGADAIEVFERVYTINEAFFTRARALVAGPVGRAIRAIFVGVGPTLSSISPSTASQTQ